MVNFTLNGKALQTTEGTTILRAAEENGVAIPHLCYLKEINEIGACRLCVVEIEGMDRLAPACNTVITEGMVIRTESPRILAARKVNLQLLLSRHRTACTSCVRNGNCTLQTLSKQFNIREIRYDLKPEKNASSGACPIVRDASKCVQCMRCVQVCDKIQGVHVWDAVGSGSRSVVDTADRRPVAETNCTYCGQCVTHCPTGALTARDDTDKVFAALANPELTTVIQVAPAVRSAWSEEFGLDTDVATVGRMVAALKAIGFDYVFDTNFTADLTIMEEGSELLARLKEADKHSWPMFTSCCPGWVRFLKTQYPAFIPNLSTAKSPQQMFGAVAKSYFAEKKGLDPHKVFVVSIMPCSAKKAECELPAMKDACGDKDVDVVLTTREFCRMLAQLNIAPAKLEETAFDSPLGSGTGAAVIFGATGGVMEAALRSAYALVTGKNPDADAFAPYRPVPGKAWKESEIQIPGAGPLKIAVASGLANTRKLMDALQNGTAKYDFVEIMACPGGCAGGGGQPIHEGQELAAYRGKKLWKLDSDSLVRFSHENTDVQALYQEYLEAPLSEKAHHLLHTDHNA
ncbi:MAG: [FeFe] hydrogenase, group A [Lentisphaeria bacterium]|nr:[FeFe] hydrogenase, group A [Lentisphaeria bacterium]